SSGTLYTILDANNARCGRNATCSSHSFVSPFFLHRSIVLSLPLSVSKMPHRNKLCYPQLYHEFQNEILTILSSFHEYVTFRLHGRNLWAVVHFFHAKCTKSPGICGFLAPSAIHFQST